MTVGGIVLAARCRNKGATVMRHFIGFVLGLLGLALMAAGSVAASSNLGGGGLAPGGGTAPLGGTPTTTPPACGWNFVPSPDFGTGASSLAAITALSANDMWAVGYYVDTVNSRTSTLTM